MTPERLARLRLARSHGVGPRSYSRLLARFGAAREALKQLNRFAPKADPCPEQTALDELRAGEAAGARLLLLGDESYPVMLAEIPDPPPVLWALGQVALVRRNCVALVGARNASAGGRRMAGDLAAGLAKAGWVVVSGLARGVDAAAHEASVGHGAVACVAGGVDVVYPPQNAALRARIAETGLILSENPPGAEPQARHFPRRNRIISGLSAGVILVEAAEKSGSLITARCAAEQGREAMAVPGSPLEPRAAGCNALIREGAALIRDVDDALEALSSPRLRLTPRAAALDPPPLAPPEPEPDADALLGLIGEAPVHVDALARLAGLSAQALAVRLLDLEMEGAVERRPGDMIVRSA